MAVGGRQLGDLSDEPLTAQGGELLGRDVDLRARDRHALGEAQQISAEAGEHRQQAGGDVVGIDLVAREEQLLRPLGGVVEVVPDQLVEPCEGVRTESAGLAARALRDA